MNKIIPLLFVLFVGEILMRHAAAVHLNFAVFLVMLVFCLVFNNKVLFEKCAIEATSNQWQVETFSTFKKGLQLKKAGSVFTEWRLTEGTEPTTTEELAQPMVMVYIA